MNLKLAAFVSDTMAVRQKMVRKSTLLPEASQVSGYCRSCLLCKIAARIRPKMANSMLRTRVAEKFFNWRSNLQKSFL